MHKFSDLVLARVALHMDPSGSVLPLQSTKVWQFGELQQEKIGTGQNQLFSASQKGQGLVVFDLWLPCNLSD